MVYIDHADWVLFGEPLKIGNEAESAAILAALEGAAFIVSSVTTKERKRHAPAPFITCWRRLRSTACR